MPSKSYTTCRLLSEVIKINNSLNFMPNFELLGPKLQIKMQERALMAMKRSVFCALINCNILYIFHAIEASFGRA